MQEASNCPAGEATPLRTAETSWVCRQTFLCFALFGMRAPAQHMVVTQLMDKYGPAYEDRTDPGDAELQERLITAHLLA